MSEFNEVELFADDFSQYPPCERMDELSDEQRLGGHVHVGNSLAGIGDPQERIGRWRQTTLHYHWRSDRIEGRYDCPLPWRIVEQAGRHYLDQPESWFNVVLAAGDPRWRDYVMQCELAVWDGPAGPVVRYHSSRQNYWIRFAAGEPVSLIRRDQDDHVTLAAANDCIPQRDHVYACRIECDGPRLTVSVDGRELFSVADDAWPRGGIALRTEGPARFTAVRVTSDRHEVARVEAENSRRAASIARKRSAIPQAKLLHSVAIPFDPSYVYVRDVNDDGRFEIVAIEAQVMELDYIRLTRLSVFDWNGKLLWQLGEPRESKYKVHGDVAINVADIDADGRTEILLTRDFEILILDGATGDVKRRTPTPLTYRGHEDHYERTIGDAFLVCNLRGLDTPRDLILKDRYCNLWAFTDELKPLWHRALNTGHYPRARDVNGDGRDEVMAGHSMLDADGNTRWVVPGGDPYRNRFPGPEHCDSVLLECFSDGDDAPVQIAMAASDMGFLLLDTDGCVLVQHRIGHAQSLAAVRFRPSLPGRQFAVQTFWGNRYIMHLFDCEGRPLLIRERPDVGTMPVNWLGDGSALLHGGSALFDGNFEPVVELPVGRNVGPGACDVNGDGVDEVLRLIDGKVHVYGPETIPADSAGGQQRRTLTNFSNYGGFYL